MITKLAHRWADWLVQNGADADNRDVFIYGFECMLNEVIATVLVFAIAFIIGRPLEMLIWQVFWLPFRINLGGHHASSHFWCIFYSTALAVGCVLLVPLIQHYDFLIWIELAFSIFVAFVFAPVIHPNRLVSDERRRKFKKDGRIICVIEAAIIAALFFFAPAWLTHTAAIGMSSAAALCLIGKFTTPKVASAE